MRRYSEGIYDLRFAILAQFRWRDRNVMSALTPALFPGEGISRNENVRVDTPEPRENIEHPTSNTEHRSERGVALPFDVRRWMFDVGCSSGFMGSGQGEGRCCFQLGRLHCKEALGTPHQHPRVMARQKTILILSDIHYASDAEKRRRGHEARIIANPLLRRAVKAYRHYIWLRDPLAHNHLLDQFLARAYAPYVRVTHR